MKLIIPDNLDQIKNNLSYIDGVILSLDGFSVNARYKIKLDDISFFCNLLRNKEIFISMNKNIKNSEIELLEKTLIKLNDYPIKGVLYADTSVVTYKDKLNYDLVWSHEHLVTNYETINYWNSFGVNYAYLSSDITLTSIKEIKKNTSVKLMGNLLGYLPMYVSMRHNVKNYLKYFKINDNSSINYLSKEGEIYPIIDDDYTTVFSGKIFSGIKDYFELPLDYYVINGMLIDNDTFTEVLKIITHLDKENIDKSNKSINNLINTSDYFLHKSTVSKVKKCKK